MNEVREKVFMKWAVVVALLGMVIINALAGILLINGVSTADISDSYPNLFAPAGITFSIWGVIYLLLILYTVYQTGILQKKNGTPVSELTGEIGFAFIVSSIANAAWIFAWHYGNIFLSMMLMIVLLVSLIIIVQRIKKEDLRVAEKWMIGLPFSVYFGWITVATIANATIFLVYLDFGGFGIPESIWMVAVLVVGMIIGVVTTIRNRDIAYGLVIVWAYAGIWIQHNPEGRHAGQYREVITTVILCIVCLISSLLYVALRRKRKSITNS
jgi:hypothetical protein